MQHLLSSLCTLADTCLDTHACMPATLLTSPGVTARRGLGLKYDTCPLHSLAVAAMCLPPPVLGLSYLYVLGHNDTKLLFFSNFSLIIKLQQSTTEDQSGAGGIGTSVCPCRLGQGDKEGRGEAIRSHQPRPAHLFTCVHLRLPVP